MFKSLTHFSRPVTALIFLTAALATATQVQAGVVVQCGAAMCSSDYKVTIDGKQVGTGTFLYDAETGDIALGDGVTSWSSGSSTVSINSLDGNADPILIFGVGASTGTLGSTFGFTFNLPIALSGPINASSKVSYSLTAGSAAGAQISPVVGSNIVSAYEVDTSIGGLGSLNKGVDVGDTFFFVPGPDVQNSPVYTASNTFTGNLAYDLMTVKIDFALSPNSAAGVSGFVEQLAVPVPAAVWLFGSGLLGLVGVAKRKHS